MSVATTYAEALYEAAADSDAVEAVAADVASFSQLVESSAELRGVLEDPEVNADQKKRAVVALVQGSHPLVVNFLQVLLDRGRIEDFPEIARAFQERVHRAEGRLDVHAITAVPLPDDLREQIAKRIEEKTGNAVDLTESVQPRHRRRPRAPHRGRRRGRLPPPPDRRAPRHAAPHLGRRGHRGILTVSTNTHST